MNQTTRTVAFLVVAGVSIGIAAATHYAYKPVDLAAFSDVGSRFYPDFEDPNVATGLRVASYDDKSGRTEEFKVELRDGLWRIPSHHGYPADGQDRLARTASSIVGVERRALVERTSAAHKRYGLLDPLDKNVAGTEGRGDRITLYQGDNVLVDFIVGNKVEGENDVYYVRRADEDRFYTADLGRLEISTKFADWIHKNVLDVSRGDVRELVIDRYHIDEARGELVREDRLRLNRESATADWTLADLDEKAEKLKTASINNMLTALNDLSIVGVRAKPAGISADLKQAEGVSITPFDILDLQGKGFYIDQRQGRILSNEGELLVGSADGALYVLRFGQEFSGSDVEIEVGSGKPGEKGEAAPSEAPADKTDVDAEPGDEKPDSGLKKSRYLFVTVQFDEELLGEKPAPPVKPEPPAEKPAQESADEKKSDAATEDKADTSQPAETEDKKPEANTPAADPDADAKPDVEPKAEMKDPQKEYEEALKRYEDELAVYEIRRQEYEEKLEKGRERVTELNRRFADWYYVISADVFDRLKLARTDLVENVEPPAEETPESPQSPADAPQSPTPPASPDSPSESPKQEPESPKPESESPQPDSPQPDAPKNESKPKGEPQPNPES